MPFKPVILWSDACIFLLMISIFVFVLWARRHEYLRTSWRQVLRNKLGVIALLILIFYVSIGFLDSLHFRSTKQQESQQNYAVRSVLDVILAPLDTMYEYSYSAPFATHSFIKSTVMGADGQVSRAFTPLQYTAQQVNSKKTVWQDVAQKSIYALIQVSIISLSVFLLLISYLAYRRKQAWRTLFLDIVHDRSFLPWRLIFITSFVLLLFSWVILSLSASYHIFGTDKIGQDVFYQSLKSIRTGLIIGTLTTLVMLPFAVLLGMFAGYFKGKVDDVIQYIYTTLSSIPSVLLIVAAVLALQVFIENHAQLFSSLEQRADIRLLALCGILGVTSWTSLCRLLRGETLKLAEMDYVQSAIVLGVNSYKIILRHILPNLMHIILITVVLDFSALVLAEAVLSYVGVGVDPSTLSWGNMINAARLELAREPIVWWPLMAAFIFMFILVLAANLFADAVRNAFDPRIRKRGI